MEDRNELSDILLGDEISEKSRKTKKILVIAALFMLLLILVLIIMKIINKPDEQKVTLTDDIVAVQVEQKQPNETVEHIIIEEPNTTLNVEVPNATGEVPKITEITAPKVETPKVDVKPKTTTQPKVAEPKVTPKSSGIVRGAYYVQVASITGNPNKSFLSSIDKKLYKYSLYDTAVGSKKVTKVLVGPFSSRKEAEAILPQIRQEIISNAFIYQVP
ncbi:MAG: SPOR domain-containing protein [Campylobacteraceae bacterium]